MSTKRGINPRAAIRTKYVACLLVQLAAVSCAWVGYQAQLNMLVDTASLFQIALVLIIFSAVTYLLFKVSWWRAITLLLLGFVTGTCLSELSIRYETLNPSPLFQLGWVVIGSALLLGLILPSGWNEFLEVFLLSACTTATATAALMHPKQFGWRWLTVVLSYSTVLAAVVVSKRQTAGQHSYGQHRPVIDAMTMLGFSFWMVIVIATLYPLIMR